jgi:hypothetical protein
MNPRKHGQCRNMEDTMSTSHHLKVVAVDESGSPLKVSSAKLTSKAGMVSGPVTWTHFGHAASTALHGFTRGEHELCISFPERPDFNFPLVITKTTGELTLSFAKSPPACCPRIQRDVENSSGAMKVTFTLLLTLTKSHSEVILVAGWDYSGGANNIAYCESYRDDLYAGTTHRTGIKTTITKRIDDATIVTVFDFKTGNRLRMMKGSSGWFRMDHILQGTVKTHLGHYKTPANAQKRHLDDSISIKHVYDHIIELGAKAPGALKDFHIFSHAWAGGPILVETHEDAAYEAGGTNAALRDPQDKDPRTKDFDPANMPRLSDFKAAFAPDSIAKIWGCMATTAYRNLIRAAAQAKSDAEIISFDWSGTSRSMTAAQAKKHLRDGIMGNTYMSRLSAAVGGSLKVYGAPPGMGADLRAVTVEKRKHEYMHINKSTYKREYEFLKSAFGVTADDTGYIFY